ncbi:hypothetical protein [Escherichia phage BF17]|nr:hypothetical protein [Escherichia coli O157]QXN76558.1 hypothetical protein [Escherichia phage BF17]
MSYREIFSIITIIVFSLGSLIWLLYYFCVTPVYNMLNSVRSDVGIVSFIIFMAYYMLSITGLVLVVIFDLGPNQDGMEMWELITMFACMIPAFGVCAGVFYGLCKGVNYLKNIHNTIRKKRML